jgi:hypothetical protein
MPVPVEDDSVDLPEQPRCSGRIRKPVDRFKFDKSHGYNTVRTYFKTIVTCLLATQANSRIYDVNYLAALAMDPHFGILDQFSDLPPDTLTRHPFMFKSKATSDPDTPTFREAMFGPHREEFLDKMLQEIQELEEHGTWDVMKKSDIQPIDLTDGTTEMPEVIPSTWGFKIKSLPIGIIDKFKVWFCVRGDLQKKSEQAKERTDVITRNGDVFETYAPVASWSSI